MEAVLFLISEKALVILKSNFFFDYILINCSWVKVKLRGVRFASVTLSKVGFHGQNLLEMKLYY
jgi:hypothetical protein